jgi:hypothetical protein
VRRVLAVFVVGALLLAGCSGGAAKPPAASGGGGGVRRIVSGPASDFLRIIVTAHGRSAVVPPGLRPTLIPLLAARTFTRPDPLATYGLDTPQAVLLYERGIGGAAVVQIGAANFDRHGIYARRPADQVVFLVLADTLRPVLALVGISIANPS